MMPMVTTGTRTGLRVASLRGITVPMCVSFCQGVVDAGLCRDANRFGGSTLRMRPARRPAYAAFASSFGITQGARKCCNPVAVSMRAAVRRWARAMGGETDVGLLSRRSRPYWVHRADTRPRGDLVRSRLAE